MSWNRYTSCHVIDILTGCQILGSLWIGRMPLTFLFWYWPNCIHKELKQMCLKLFFTFLKDTTNIPSSILASYFCCMSSPLSLPSVFPVDKKGKRDKKTTTTTNDSTPWIKTFLFKIFEKCGTVWGLEMIRAVFVSNSGYQKLSDSR